MAYTFPVMDKLLTHHWTTPIWRSWILINFLQAQFYSTDSYSFISSTSIIPDQTSPDEVLTVYRTSQSSTVLCCHHQIHLTIDSMFHSSAIGITHLNQNERNCYSSTDLYCHHQIHPTIDSMFHSSAIGITHLNQNERNCYSSTDLYCHHQIHLTIDSMFHSVL